MADPDDRPETSPEPDDASPEAPSSAEEQERFSEGHRSVREVMSEGGDVPEAPVLVAPDEEEIVDGEDVTLEWEAVEGADSYLVEVAEDAPFHKVVIQEEVDGTSLHVEALATDGRRYYWRVITQRGGTLGHGDRIESFTSATAEEVRDAAAQGGTPDQGEGYGPAAELFSSAGAEAAAEATGSDEDRFRREREQGVAHEGVESGQIMGLAAVVVLAIVIIVCILLFWVTSVADATQEATTDALVYPEIRETQTRAAQQLEQYELVSERDGTYRIPIGEAMRIVADEAYQEAPRQRFSGELQMGVPATLSDSLQTDPFVPEPSAPEGPAGAAQN